MQFYNIKDKKILNPPENKKKKRKPEVNMATVKLEENEEIL